MTKLSKALAGLGVMVGEPCAKARGQAGAVGVPEGVVPL